MKLAYQLFQFFFKKKLSSYEKTVCKVPKTNPTKPSLLQEKAGRANTFGKEDLRLFKSMMSPSTIIATDAGGGRQRR